MTRILTALTFLPLLVGGCAKYEFDLVRPEKSAAIVGRKADTVVTLDPLEYHLRAVEGNLVVRVRNPTSDPIQLLGDRSSAVDARGEAHPLKGQTIPPGAFVKVIVPPPRPTAYDSGPHFGFGFGVIGSSRYGRGFADPWFFDSPRTYTLYDEGNNAYWDWKPGARARLVFSFERNGRTFTDEFEFEKRKAK